jgi:hypothetical protein
MNSKIGIGLGYKTHKRAGIMSKIYYGATSTQNIVDCIRKSCEVIKPDNVPQAMEQCIFTGCAESGLGTARDGYEKQGRGWAQFDLIRFSDNMQRLKSPRHEDLFNRIKYEFDFKWMYFEQLDYSPLLSAVHCRLAYYFVRDPLPAVGDRLAQSHYWVKHYNVSGAGKVPEGVARAKAHYFG